MGVGRRERVEGERGQDGRGGGGMEEEREGRCGEGKREEERGEETCKEKRVSREGEI